MSRHAARRYSAVRDPHTSRTSVVRTTETGPANARTAEPGAGVVSASELIARYRLAELAATLPTAPLPDLTGSDAPPTVVPAAELIARHRRGSSTASAPAGRPAPARPSPVRPSMAPTSAALDRARHRTGSTAPVARSMRLSSGRRSAAHRPVPVPREAPLLAALRPARPIAVVVRPVLVAAAVVATVTAMDVPSFGHPSSVASDAPNAAGDRARAAAAGTATSRATGTAAGTPAGTVASTVAGGSAGVGNTPSSVGGQAAVANTASPSQSPSPHGTDLDVPPPPKTVAVNSATPQRTTQVPKPSATNTRISRDRRTSKPAHKPLMKAGQTVPGAWVRPNSGPESSCFCMRWGVMHEGIDLAGPLGSPILAVGDGVVLQAGPAQGFGNWVVIQHANGDVSIYGHMQYYFVSAGERVTAGQRIALVGSEGQSTGPHLHFEIHSGGFDGPPIDPEPWLRARGISVGSYDPNG